MLYSITFEDSSVRIRKARIPVFSVGLNERLDDTSYTVLDDRAVPMEVFEFIGSYTKYGEFLDGKDGYWYGFSNLSGLLVSNSKKTKGIRWLAAVPVCLLPFAFLDFSGNYLDAYSAMALFL